MKFFDLTLPLSSQTVPWPGDTPFTRQEAKGTAIVSRLIMSSHTGTHIDAPRHFVFSKHGIDAINLSQLVGQARVIKITAYPEISLADVKKIKLKKYDKILFKTRNSRLTRERKFRSDYVSLSLPAALYLAEKRVDLVGIDYLGIEKKSAPGHPVHKTLLRAEIVIVEGLNLSKIQPGNYHIAALPLKIKSGDGSPARVILWR